jgi:hypothetical protein
VPISSIEWLDYGALPPVVANTLIRYSKGRFDSFTPYFEVSEADGLAVYGVLPKQKHPWIT